MHPPSADTRTRPTPERNLGLAMSGTMEARKVAAIACRILGGIKRHCSTVVPPRAAGKSAGRSSAGDGQIQCRTPGSAQDRSASARHGQSIWVASMSPYRSSTVMPARLTAPARKLFANEGVESRPPTLPRLQAARVDEACEGLIASVHTNERSPQGRRLLPSAERAHQFPFLVLNRPASSTLARNCTERAQRAQRNRLWANYLLAPFICVSTLARTIGVRAKSMERRLQHVM